MVVDLDDSLQDGVRTRVTHNTVANDASMYCRAEK